MNRTLVDEAVDTTAAIRAEEALQIAKSSVHAPEEFTYEPTAELVVYPFEGKNYIAYKANVNFMGEAPGNWFVFVDANTGEVIDQYNGIMHADEINTQSRIRSTRGPQRITYF